jgi:3-hydroxyacyl-CoA dehydrogenase/enoyl-CoA hydratase/3-hydroxybutyryl-CoA epimerase
MTGNNVKSIRLERRADQVGVIWIDVPGESQNTLKERFRPEMDEVWKEIDRSSLRAVVIASAKDSSFIAGADIELLKNMKTIEDGEAGSRAGQKAFDELEASTRPVVAAIHGACLGGGLELALACRARVASNDPKTKLGLPEVQLGLLPGAGGTQRLPALVGVEAALDMMLTGKQIDAKRAKKMGLVDDVVPRAILVDTAAELALSLAGEAERKAHPSIADRFSELSGTISHLADPKVLRAVAMAKNPAGRMIVFDQAEKMVRKTAGAHYPAPFKILEVVRIGLERGRAAGLEAEAKRFGELLMSDVSRRLIQIFFATTALKKDNGTAKPDLKPVPVKKVGVLGAGLMGHGIAYVTAQSAGLQVRLRDRDEAAVAKGMKAVAGILEERVKKRRMTEYERDRLLSQITPTTDLSGFKSCQVVIEAVFEDLAVKHKVLKEIEALSGPEMIFASNTSSIPITRIAEGASRPDRVVGMHYFSPVHKMPLLEVIRTRQTSDQVVATVVELGKKQGKTVIVVNDGVGFYTSRVLAPYMNEASWMLAEGVPIEEIDAAAKAFGFPVGPITLLDEVGIDTAEKVGHIMHAAFGDRLTPPPGLDKLIADGRSGRKGGKGFYTYGGKKKQVDQTIYPLLGIEPRPRGKDATEELGQRLGLAFVQEAIRCLAEGILRSPRDGDVGAIFGLGFPPFRGGPFRYADSLGPAELLRRIRGYADRYGKRYAPAELLMEHAKTGNRFYE